MTHALIRTHQTRLGSLLELMPEIAGLAVSDFELIQPAQYLHEKDLLLHAGRRSVELWQASSAKMINRIDLSEDILHAEITRNGELLAIYLRLQNVRSFVLATENI